MNKLDTDFYSPIQKPSVILSAISGHVLPCLGTTNIQLGIEGIITPHTFHIIHTHAMTPPVLLGDTFLLENRIVIDRFNNSLTYHSVEIPYLCKHELNHKLTCPMVPMARALYADQVVGLDPPTPVSSRRIGLDKFLRDQSKDLINAQGYDHAIQTAKRYVTGDTSAFSDSEDPWILSFERHADNLFYNRTDDVLYYSNTPDSDRIIIPKSWVPVMLHHFHGSLSAGHPSFDAAYNAARDVCFWPGMPGRHAY